MKIDATMLCKSFKDQDAWRLRSVEDIEGGPASEWHMTRHGHWHEQRDEDGNWEELWVEDYDENCHKEEDDFLALSLGLPVFQCPEYRK